MRRSRGRIAVSAGHLGVRAPARLLLAAAATALAAGCGGLASPDLTTGQVTGAIAGARPGAYVYVLGSPQLQASVGAGGAFTLDRVPVGTARVVVYDGDARAELIPVEVQPASRAHLARDAADMPLAGRVVPVPRPAGGSSVDGARFSVEGTVLAGVTADAVFPLPPGDFSVVATLRGFKQSTKAVTVSAAASIALEIALDIDDADPLRGCVAVGGCWPGLLCDADDGRCYECTRDADCGAGTCTSDHVCSNQPLGCGEACGAGATCRSGLTCVGGTCAAIAGCAAWMQTYGSLCAVDYDVPPTCGLALAGGQCYVAPGATGELAEVGYCTAPCASDAECPTSYRCDAATHLCLR